MRRRGERTLGPYKQHNGWRVVRIDAQGNRASTIYETEVMARTTIADPLRWPDTRPGDLYAISLMPEVRPLRIKIGFTRTIALRIRSFRAVCPTLELLRTWPAEIEHEALVLSALPGRIGNSEVFVCDDSSALLATIDHVLRAN